MTEEDLIKYTSGLAGVTVVTAGEENGAPEVAWGDTFFFYDPHGDTPPDRRLPFTTIVTKDYPGFDAESDLNRPGTFRVNIAIGRDGFQQAFGYPPAAHAEHHGDHDYAAGDQVVPHPVYAAQGWVSVVNPGERTSGQVQTLIAEAHARAAARYRRR